jgi:Fur family ferric uptake transcriptional regulator
VRNVCSAKAGGITINPAGKREMRSKIKKRIDNLLGSAKLKRTGPRTAILSVLLSAGMPQTACQVAAKLSGTIPNKVTIYRTLESFCRAGLVHKAFIHKRAVYFELANRCSEIRCHPHFTCKVCGVTNCLIGLSVPLVKGLKKGFVIHRQEVQLEGLCPRCA